IPNARVEKSCGSHNRSAQAREERGLAKTYLAHRNTRCNSSQILAQPREFKLIVMGSHNRYPSPLANTLRREPGIKRMPVSYSSGGMVTEKVEAFPTSLSPSNLPPSHSLRFFAVKSTTPMPS